MGKTEEPFGSVYVIEATKGYCKVGLSVDPAKRVRLLKPGHPNVTLHLTLELPYPVAKLVEREAQSSLREFRRSGEWFEVAPSRAMEAVTACGARYAEVRVEQSSRAAQCVGRYREQNNELYALEKTFEEEERQWLRRRDYLRNLIGRTKSEIDRVLTEFHAIGVPDKLFISEYMGPMSAIGHRDDDSVLKAFFGVPLPRGDRN